MTIKLSEIRNLKNTFDFDSSELLQVIENIVNGESDFEESEVRFILESDIDHVQAEELQNDLYILGCFNASFIADQCNWPIELVQAAQDGNAFEALGKAIADNCNMVEFAMAYSSADGYGHHFNGYDGESEELTINDNDYIVFKCKA